MMFVKPKGGLSCLPLEQMGYGSAGGCFGPVPMQRDRILNLLSLAQDIGSFEVL